MQNNEPNDPWRLLRGQIGFQIYGDEKNIKITCIQLNYFTSSNKMLKRDNSDNAQKRREHSRGVTAAPPVSRNVKCHDNYNYGRAPQLLKETLNTQKCVADNLYYS